MLLHWLRTRLSKKSASRKVSPRRPRFFRPQLLLLEDRIAPATVHWDGGASTFNWNDATNWENNQKPTANDDAVIDTSGITIVHSTGSDAVKSLTSNASFTLSGGTLQVTGLFSTT